MFVHFLISSRDIYVIMPHPTVNTTSILCKVKQFITDFLSVSIVYLEVFSLCLCLSLSNCLKTCLDRWQKKPCTTGFIPIHFWQTLTSISLSPQINTPEIAGSFQLLHYLDRSLSLNINLSIYKISFNSQSHLDFRSPLVHHEAKLRTN